MKPWDEDTGGTRTVSERAHACRAVHMAWAEAMKVDVAGGDMAGGRGK